ncbi:MAG: N-formylglutamate amidohydrolase [Pseudomonadota bacterium]
MSDDFDPNAPFHIDGAARPGRWLITCDHATNRVPGEIGGLGLPAEDMERHIAYDVGALGVARALGELLDAPVVSSNFSRLVIDPNRGEEDPTLIMQLYDGSIIPGNRSVDAGERERRLNAYHRPYHDALAKLAEGRVICSMHSFTPQLRGRAPRPWEIGVLFASDRRLSDPFIAALSRDTSLTVGVNEPYNGDLPGDAVDRHALRHDRLNVLIELRNDLIAGPAGQIAWAERLVAPLTEALKAAEA